MAMMWWILGLLLLCALITDIRSNRIPNWLTVSGMIAGGARHVVNGDIWAVKDAFLGLCVGFVLLLLLYLLGAVGAGDVKLFAAIGAVTGTAFVLYCAFYSILFAGLIGSVILIRRKLFVGRARKMLFGLFAMISWKDRQAFHFMNRKDMLRFPFMYAVLPAVIVIAVQYLTVGGVI